MKIRTGFVSNSSSTSFCIMGVFVGECEGEKAEELTKGNELQVEYGCCEGDDSVYVGLPPEKMKDDETLLQFKTRIADQLEGYEITDLDWITDGGYNG